MDRVYVRFVPLVCDSLFFPAIFPSPLLQTILSFSFSLSLSQPRYFLLFSDDSTIQARGCRPSVCTRAAGRNSPMPTNLVSITPVRRCFMKAKRVSLEDLGALFYFIFVLFGQLSTYVLWEELDLPYQRVGSLAPPHGKTLTN